MSLVSIGDFISRIGPYFAISSVAWLSAVFFLAFCVFETGEHGLKMVHVFKHSEPGNVLFKHHRQWVTRTLLAGIASFSLTRAVTYTAHVGFPSGWMRDFLWVHITVGFMCVAVFFLALTWLTGVKHPLAHHRIVLPGFAAFLLFVFPSGLFFYGLILWKVLVRAHYL